MDRRCWGQLLQQANQAYSIAPHDFWKLSVWEWQQLIKRNLVVHANQNDLELLAAKYPDQIIED